MKSTPNAIDYNYRRVIIHSPPPNQCFFFLVYQENYFPQIDDYYRRVIQNPNLYPHETMSPADEAGALRLDISTPPSVQGTPTEPCHVAGSECSARIFFCKKKTVRFSKKKPQIRILENLGCIKMMEKKSK